jgi:EAL domain-containing protein (putative c-di-GMP-specific phosphodiesterase class I)
MSVPVRSLLTSGKLRVRFLPVVSLLGEAPLVAWEACCGGPEGSPFEAPHALAGLSRELGLEISVDEATLLASLEGAAGLREPPALHLTLHGGSMARPWFARTLLHTLERRRIPAASVTLRLLDPQPHTGAVVAARTELQLEGVSLSLLVDKHLYAAPETLMRLAPDLLELDFNLARRASRHGLQEALLTSVSRLARSAGARTLARGLRTPEELVQAVQHGFELGQGPLVGEPVVPALGEPQRARSA